MRATGERSRTRARRAAMAMIVAISVLLVGHILLGISTGSLADQTGAANVAYDGVTILTSAVFAFVGRAIVTKQPRNTIGWLLLSIPLMTAFALFAGDYATYALAKHPGSLPFGRVAAWIDRWAIVPTLVVFIPLFLLFPDGRIPSRRWRPALWLTVLAPTVAIVSFALTPGRLTGAFADLTSVHVTNPLGIGGLRAPLALLTEIGGFGSLMAAILAGAAISTRYRGASGEVRQQIRWLAFVALAFLVEFVVNLVVAAVSGDNGTLGTVGFLAMFVTLALGVPAACAVAILKYRLYDLDVIVKKTVIAAVLIVLMGGIGIAVLAIVGQVAFWKDTSPAVSVAIGVGVGVSFMPLLRVSRRITDRIVYGERATPYEVLTEFSDRMAETFATDDVLPRMAQILSAATGAEEATVWLRVGQELRPAASSPEDATAEKVAMNGETLPDFDESHVVEVRHQGDLLGALSVRMASNDPINPARGRLVRDLAGQAGLILRNVSLLEEIRESRRRIVAAQDERAKKLERNIHDGAQQQLVALSVHLRLLEQTIARDPDAARAEAARLQVAANDALEDLRDLARGIYPPLLADEGLAAALATQARKSPTPASVRPDGVGRYSQEIESAFYFCALEALNNVVKYADASHVEIELSAGDGWLRFLVRDDGSGFDPASTAHGTGLHGMADRLEAIGGSLAITSSPGAGTTVSGRAPVVRSD